MAFDAHKNLAIASVTNAPGAAGTTLTVAGGEGARFPAVPFNATVWPATELPTPVTAEVVRVTATAADSFTITRSQEGTTARAIVAGDLIAATITAKTITDIESGVNFPLITTPGVVTASDLKLVAGPVNTAHLIAPLTADGADHQSVSLCAGGADAVNRGASILLTGNEHGWPGNIALTAGQTSNGVIQFSTGANVNRGMIHASGGFSWGGTTDPGAGNLSVAGDLVLAGASGLIHTNTVPGADTKVAQLAGGGLGTYARGAYFNLFGNDVAGAGGRMEFAAGNLITGQIMFNTGAGLTRGVIHQSGGFSWGGTADPGANAMSVGGNPSTAGQAGVWMHINGTMAVGAPGTAQAYVVTFHNSNGRVGQIETAGTATTYSTSSDARLKTPLTRHTDPSVLRDTIIHNFVWTADGTPGRGVFAQEAHAVAPFAVSVGTDDVDDQGRLTKPWGVDYSKYVPDLITGWQDHDDRIAAAFTRINALELVVVQAQLAAITPPPYRSPHGGAMLLQRVRDWMDRIRGWFFPQESPCV